MPQTPPPGFVIRRDDPRRRRLIAAGVAALALVALVAGYVAGRYAGTEARERTQRYRELMTELQEAYGTNGQLRERIAALERSEQVARNANAELRELIARLQEQLASVRGDLSLYKGLAAAGGDQSGLGVHQLVITPTMAPNVFEFTLTLMQDIESAEPVKGRVRVLLEGSSDGRAARLGLEALHPGSSASLPFSFRYFQLLEGSLTLPEDFRPGRVVIRLEPEEKERSETVEADFDWSAVVQPARQRARSGGTGS